MPDKLTVLKEIIFDDEDAVDEYLNARRAAMNDLGEDASEDEIIEHISKAFAGTL